jgi:hypothetical protein
VIVNYSEYVKTYTTAPPAYDGMGTIALVAEIARTRDGHTVRLVATPPAHVGWQRGRYASGLHLTADVDEWQEIVGAGLVVLPPALSPLVDL